MGAEWVVFWAGMEGALVTSRIAKEAPSLERKNIVLLSTAFSNSSRLRSASIPPRWRIG
jgi:hypothetical protein